MMIRFDGFGGSSLAVALVAYVLWLAFAIGLIVLIALAIRWLLRNTGDGGRPGPELRPGEDSALAVLRERFARGEIDATEYEERKRILGG